MVWDRGTWSAAGRSGRGLCARAISSSRWTARSSRAAWRWCARAAASTAASRATRRGSSSRRRTSTRSPATARIVDAAPDSVATGRSLDAIARGRKHVWQLAALGQGKRARRRDRRAGGTAQDGAEAREVPHRGARQEGAHAGVDRARARDAGRRSAPDGDDWITRSSTTATGWWVASTAARARLFSRNGKEWTSAFPGIAQRPGVAAGACGVDRRRSRGARRARAAPASRRCRMRCPMRRRARPRRSSRSTSCTATATICAASR